MIKMRIVSHIHSSDFSNDGKFSLKDIASMFKRRGVSVIFITEHSEDMNKNKMSQLVSKCEEISNNSLALIPGLEFSVKEGYHILGIGVSKFSKMKDSKGIIRFIRKEGGLSILAHPLRYKKNDFKELKEINAIEICNFEYDGFLPRLSNIELFQNFKENNSGIIPVSGLDFHRKIHDQKIFIKIEDTKVEKNDILKKLKEGDFKLEFNLLSINSELKFNKLNHILFKSNSILYDTGKRAGISLFSFLRKINLK
ncbi:MAG: hypothetical protein GF368_02650 [Candidatus Aenigmarchaeota archaeon]|nr:hypothetical protein [Candidatus Aenigmarchaeota archaeon]